MSYKPILLVLSLLFLPLLCRAGEIEYSLNFQWNIPAPTIYDMKMMPNQTQFLMMTEGEFQLRDALTGNLVNSYPKIPSSASNFEFTPDSTKIIVGNGESLVLLDTTDMNMISSLSLTQDSLVNYFYKLAIDPIRPYVYTIIRKERAIPNPVTILSRVVVFNYETMEQVADITPVDEKEFISQIAVSKDGKYLATLNDGNTFLCVWELDSMKLIKKISLAKDFNGSPTGIARCLKFSEINIDNIFYSGKFPRFNNDANHGGLFKYNIQTDELDSSYVYNLTKIEGGYFALFDNEERSLDGGTINLTIFNLINDSLEVRFKPSDDGTGAWRKIINTKNNGINMFIGYSSTLSMAFYDTHTGIQPGIIQNHELFPNPTNGIVTINNDCLLSKTNCKILNENGQIVNNIVNPINNNGLSIDFSSYTSGIYFVQINCNKTLYTYKVVKE